MTFSGRCAALCAGILITLGGMTAPARAQSDLKIDTTSPSPSAAVIESWVDTQAKDLTSGDRDKVVLARQALMLPNTPAEKSPKFIEIYAKTVGDKLGPIAGSSDAHARLNSAMVVGKVAEMGATAEIIPLVVKFIGDESPAVSMYGIRAASSILPRTFADKKIAGGETIMPAIMAAVKKHGASEAVIGEAYQSPIRVLSNTQAANALPAGTVVAATPPAIEALLELLNERISHYGNGTVVDPGAEGPAIGFLARTTSWAAMNQQTQNKTVEIILAIANGATKELGIEDSRKNNRSRLVSIQNLLKSPISQSLNVIGNQAKQPNLVTVANKLKNMTSITPPAQWELVVNEITAEFAKAFNVTPPTTSTTKASDTQPAK